MYWLLRTWVWGLHSQRHFKLFLSPRFNLTKLNRFKFVGSSNIGEPCQFKELRALKLSRMVFIKFPSKDNDFNFVRFLKFKANPIPFPIKHPRSSKWLKALSWPKLLGNISMLGFWNISSSSSCSKYPKFLGRVSKHLHPRTPRKFLLCCSIVLTIQILFVRLEVTLL